MKNIKKGLLALVNLLLVIVLLVSCFTVVKPMPHYVQDVSWIATEDAQFVPASDPAILYSGRIDFSDPQGPRFDWPGISIRTWFEGTSLAIKLLDQGNMYNVFIDGREQVVLACSPNTLVYTVVRGLEAGRHELLITKRTEAYDGMGQFMGLYTDKGAALAKPPRPMLKVEIIGDSISCGYGNESTDVLCGELKPYENNYMTYGAVTARALGADYHVVAVSGIGMVRNYGAPKTTSPDPLPYYYDRVRFGSDLKWDFASWTPDIVLLHLGTNDFSTQPRPLQADFKTAYKKFAARIRALYPHAYIFCLAGPMSTDAMAGNVAAAAADLSATDSKVNYFLFPEAQFEGLLGCHWHPNVAGHIKMAGMLFPFIKNVISRH